MFVRNADPDFITDQGTDIGAAVELGKRMLETSAGAGKALIVLSDGENHEEKALQRVREARESGLLVYTVSIGTAAGSTIPVRRGEMQRDFNGQAIRTSANETMLTSVANAGGGQAFSVQQGARAISALKEAIGKLQKNAVQANATTKKNYYFPWLLLLSLLVLVSEQVLWWRGKTMLLLLLGSGVATTATAQNNHRDLRSGDVYYEKQDFAAAQTAYQQAGGATGNYNAGNAAAKQQSLEDAAGFYQAALSKTSDPQRKADAWFNLGNVLLQQRKFADAIKAYESSLRLLPNQADAQKNLQIAKRQLQQPPPPTPPPPPPPPQRQPPPRRNYLDQALSSRLRETPPASLPPETARQMLSKAVLSEEQKNARAYRELSPATRASRLKKDW
jgi:Ca-activated chloride channel family protein